MYGMYQCCEAYMEHASRQKSMNAAWWEAGVRQTCGQGVGPTCRARCTRMQVTHANAGKHDLQVDKHKDAGHTHRLPRRVYPRHVPGSTDANKQKYMRTPCRHKEAGRRPALPNAGRSNRRASDGGGLRSEDVGAHRMLPAPPFALALCLGRWKPVQRPSLFHV